VLAGIVVTDESPSDHLWRATTMQAEDQMFLRLARAVNGKALLSAIYEIGFYAAVVASWILASPFLPDGLGVVLALALAFGATVRLLW
jgi:hypothetical protein